MRAKAQVVSAEYAVSQIPNGATVACSGFVGAAHPELLTATIEKHFSREATPRDLTLVYAAGQGDGKDRGLNHLAHMGLIKRVVGGHWNLAPKLGRLALENHIEAYNFPQGVISVLFREIAAGRPGVFTKVGMDTFCDPDSYGGKLSACTSEDLVEKIKLDGEEWLWYRTFPINVALIRATKADSRGNLSFDDEGIVGEVLPIAQAAHNCGGIVIAQVKEVVHSPLPPKSVRVPGILVDYVVVADEEHHQQTFAEGFNPNYVCAREEGSSLPVMRFSERKIIASRALMEVHEGDLVNLGIGLPEGVASVASETGRLDDFTLTVESGPTGGVPASGLSFGCSSYPEAILDQPSQFDFYDGGGLDFAVLGAVEIDSHGSVNVSKFSGRIAGVGGFVNISQNAKRIVFCCTFRAGGLEIETENGELRIVNEGAHCKFVSELEQVSFHGPSAVARGQEVLYVTERAVFKLTRHGMELVEIAPGIDLKHQVLDLMEWRPHYNELQLMPEQCFLHK